MKEHILICDVCERKYEEWRGDQHLLISPTQFMARPGYRWVTIQMDARLTRHTSESLETVEAEICKSCYSELLDACAWQIREVAKRLADGTIDYLMTQEAIDEWFTHCWRPERFKRLNKEIKQIKEGLGQ